MFHTSTSLFLFSLIFCAYAHPADLNNSKYMRQIHRYPYNLQELTVIGEPMSYVVKDNDTFLDIARDHELGINEMTILYPGADPWMPPQGKTLTIPASWVLPPTQLEQMVINIPEMRLYVFKKEAAQVQTYPVGIGSEGWKTPEGNFSITEKRSNPCWYVPESLQKEYGLAIMPPGPDNPLGRYIMRFSDSSYGIHGTHMPWGVGRLISHGCIRCYPEHISLIYPQVALGTKIELIYEPVKFGAKNGRIYIEVHPDVYDNIPDFNHYAANKLKHFNRAHRVDPAKYSRAVRLRDGVPTDVTLSTEATHNDNTEKQNTPWEPTKTAPRSGDSDKDIDAENLSAHKYSFPIK